MEGITYERRGRTVYITLNRPEVLNAINRAMRQELRDAFLRFREDREAWVAILSGAGERAFSAGVDLKELAGSGPQAAWDAFWALEGYGALETDLHHWKPVIAAVHGYCLGIACTLVMACDIRIAAEDARFGFPEVKRGIPTVIGTILLARKVGLSAALPLLLTGDAIDAHEAHRLGMVHRVVPRHQLMAEAERWAASILENAPLAVQATKELAVRSVEMPFDHAWRLGEGLRALCAQSQDAQEGPRAFVERRRPIYQGR